MERRLVPIRLDSYKPLREVVAETLREAIVAGTLKPGERLMEIQLAEELGVSRTPVREAIRKLELEGFVVMIPRRGTYVADLSIKDINEVFEIRTALDVLAAGLAVERITEDELEQLERLLVEIVELLDHQDDIEKIVEVDSQFHDVLYRASRNDRLVGIINNLREQFTRFRSISIQYPGRMRISVEEHRRLVEAIATRDTELAQQIAREHMENSEQTLLQDLNERRQV
ncbi:GntR family transcriptional regulator [Sporomusa acidovorans]|uniref:HTH-type transcriptional regulator McbR n=1 Tax=Sporomusa acidovorans (strain ATCC 49682 / DSM 3132 / Mol) TaxID=1123286 RepID=A0ABZ3IWW7_SPOA4|nr:GntR family transcriptional regulator [Sporomusa acidovorans]OZC14023.1 HTH-type transcriptional regulator McbR [Sporomusa acidovorans DSM 3132]SDF22645.1 DNA-binding transcriptional regulator, GntR family [Sporomusa acidovorans]